MVEAVKNGRKVKDFKLKDQNGQDFRLADYQGKRVLLSFHPLAWTPVCARQMQSLEKSKKPWISSIPWPQASASTAFPARQPGPKA
jgi:peroxiredoxin